MEEFAQCELARHANLKSEPVQAMQNLFSLLSNNQRLTRILLVGNSVKKNNNMILQLLE